MSHCRVERIGIRELRQNASAYVDMVWHEGVTVEITNRGHLAARLVPAAQPDDPLTDLEADGLVVHRAERPGELTDLEPLPAMTGGPSLGEVLREMREEERY